MQRLSILSLLVAAAVLAIPESAGAGAAYEAGLRIAARRGLPNAACFARVFETRAHLDQWGRWRGPIGRRSRGPMIFRLELFNRCGIRA